MDLLSHSLFLYLSLSEIISFNSALGCFLSNEPFLEPMVKSQILSIDLETEILWFYESISWSTNSSRGGEAVMRLLDNPTLFNNSLKLFFSTFELITLRASSISVLSFYNSLIRRFFLLISLLKLSVSFPSGIGLVPLLILS